MRFEAKARGGRYANVTCGCYIVTSVGRGNGNFVQASWESKNYWHLPERDNKVSACGLCGSFVPRPS